MERLISLTILSMPTYKIISNARKVPISLLPISFQTTVSPAILNGTISMYLLARIPSICSFLSIVSESYYILLSSLVLDAKMGHACLQQDIVGAVQIALYPPPILPVFHTFLQTLLLSRIRILGRPNPLHPAVSLKRVVRVMAEIAEIAKW